jgi:hypothetical protein
MVSARFTPNSETERSPVRSQDDIRPAGNPAAPSNGGGPARIDAVNRSPAAAAAAAERSQRRLVQLSLLLRPPGR